MNMQQSEGYFFPSGVLTGNLILYPVQVLSVAISHFFIVKSIQRISLIFFLSHMDKLRSGLEASLAFHTSLLEGFNLFFSPAFLLQDMFVLSKIKSSGSRLGNDHICTSKLKRMEA